MVVVMGVMELGQHGRALKFSANRGGFNWVKCRRQWVKGAQDGSPIAPSQFGQKTGPNSWWNGNNLGKFLVRFRSWEMVGPGKWQNAVKLRRSGNGGCLASSLRTGIYWPLCRTVLSNRRLRERYRIRRRWNSRRMEICGCW